MTVSSHSKIDNMSGQGCPNCGFGTICPKCHGGLIEKNGCPTCFGGGYLFARRCPNGANARFHQWFIGYTDCPDYPLRFMDKVEIIREEKPEESADRKVYEAKIKCPDCHGEGEPCSECGGNGEFHSEQRPDLFERAVESLLDNSDAEPIGLLTRFISQTPRHEPVPDTER